MNEITRIHIAKTAYDIEIAAKKQLEKYIKSLETYAQDADVVTDIEIRITELLAERSIKPGGVINSEDVSALRKQLGEPYEFAGEEGDIAVGSENENSGTRRLYRSTDNAVLQYQSTMDATGVCSSDIYVIWPCCTWLHFSLDHDSAGSNCHRKTKASWKSGNG